MEESDLMNGNRDKEGHLIRANKKLKPIFNLEGKGTCWPPPPTFVFPQLLNFLMCVFFIFFNC